MRDAPGPVGVGARAPSGPTPGATPAGALFSVPAPSVTEAALHDGSALERLLDEFRRRTPGATGVDLGLVERAYKIAEGAHQKQRRRSGEPYFVHPVRVATTIAQLGLDASSVAAGLLHDAVEDSELTVFDVGEQFGRVVATIVDGVTKLGKVPYLSRQEQQAESFRKMLLAMSEDIRVLIVKLIDRLDNMRTLDHLPRDKQERISRETMQIYAPLAGRLGIEWVRRELQDLSFKYLEPQAHGAIEGAIESLFEAQPDTVETTLAALTDAFSGASGQSHGGDEPSRWPYAQLGPVVVRATARPPYRVHRRLEAAGRGIDQISDVVTYQIVTRDRAACYSALGQLHARFQPVPGRFRDYIALPRPNRYRALHTSVIDRAGQRIEVQIRSRAMDAVAERGIVADWGRAGGQSSSESQRLRWLGQLMDWQQEVQDPHEFIEAVKADLFADEVYVFTPKGDIHTFQKGATPIDFAFAIHTDVGMRCSGARVNGHVVPLRYRLRQGDTVEIITNPNSTPREEWLKMSASSRARAKIKQFLRNRERERLRALGRRPGAAGGADARRDPGRARAQRVDRQAGERARAAQRGQGRDRGLRGRGGGAGARRSGGRASRLARGRGEPAHPSGAARRRSRPAAAPTRRRRQQPFGPGDHHAGPRGGARGRGGDRVAVAVLLSAARRPADRPVRAGPGHRGPRAGLPRGARAGRRAAGPRRLRGGAPDRAPGHPRGPDLEHGRPARRDEQGVLPPRRQHQAGQLPRVGRGGTRRSTPFYASVSDLAQLEALIATLKGIDGVGTVERVFSAGSGIYPRA